VGAGVQRVQKGGGERGTPKKKKIGLNAESAWAGRKKYFHLERVQGEREKSDKTCAASLCFGARTVPLRRNSGSKKGHVVTGRGVKKTRDKRRLKR